MRLSCKSLQVILPQIQASGSVIHPPEQCPIYIFGSQNKKVKFYKLLSDTYVLRAGGMAEDHRSAIREPEDDSIASLVDNHAKS